MPHTPGWYPGKAESTIGDEADTLEVLALDPAKAIVTKTVFTCPSCGARKEEEMPLDSSVHFYTCTHCQKVLKPIYGDCCVFCSYATVICPQEQRRGLEDVSASMRRHVGDLRTLLKSEGK